MLPQNIRELLDDLSHSLQTEWSWSGVCFQGLSVSRTFPIEIGGSKLALRDWGWGTERMNVVRDKLRFQHQLQRDWAKITTSNPDQLIEQISSFTNAEDSDCPIPRVWQSWARGQPVAIAENSIWSLSGWKDGSAPPLDEQWSQEQIAAAITTLARMHAISMRHSMYLKPSEGWSVRSIRLKSIDNNTFNYSEARNSVLLKRSFELIQKCKNWGLLKRLQDYASEKSRTNYPCCWIVRDPHRGNWLFDRSQVSAFVDFAAAGVDWFGWDIVRLLSSCRLSHAQFEASFQIYIDALDKFGLPGASIVFIRNLPDWSAMKSIQLLLSIEQWSQWSTGGALSAKGMQQWQLLIEQAESTLSEENCGNGH